MLFFDKSWSAELIDLKFFMKTKKVRCKKTSQNNFFISQALHCENAIWNLQILRILFQNCPIFRFRPSSQLWHPSFSPLYDVFNLTTHVFSESLWHVLFTDAPVMTIKKTHANTKTKTKTMTKTKWLKDLACAIFFKMIWLKDIKSDDESVMHH